MQIVRRAPQQLFLYNNKLQFSDLTSNQVVGSSNRSEEREAQRQVEPRSGDEAAMVPSNLSERAKYKRGDSMDPPFCV